MQSDRIRHLRWIYGFHMHACTFINIYTSINITQREIDTNMGMTYKLGISHEQMKTSVFHFYGFSFHPHLQSEYLSANISWSQVF